jgi:hypothetical protein
VGERKLGIMIKLICSLAVVVSLPSASDALAGQATGSFRVGFTVTAPPSPQSATRTGNAADAPALSPARKKRNAAPPLHRDPTSATP